MLSSEETRRYARHLVLKGFGGTAQQKLKAARVLVIGAGGLGSPALAYLAAAGVGTLGIIDHDEVGLSNLQRQMVHTTKAVGTEKTESARAFINAINPNVIVEAHAVKLDAGNARLCLNTSVALVPPKPNDCSTARCRSWRCRCACARSACLRRPDRGSRYWRSRR
jgi:molybdopterin/thiamine biosynthesis adenylyltransferase